MGDRDDDAEVRGTEERFDPVAGTWQVLAPMSVGRSHHTASVIAGQLYIVGGRSAEDNVLDNAERFNPVAGTWEVLGTMAVARFVHSASVIAGQLYVVGGADNTENESVRRPLVIPSRGPVNHCMDAPVDSLRGPC